MASNYKTCIVPNCDVNSIRNPGKIFVNLPKNPIIRKTWLNVIGRTKPLSNNSVRHVCEDHFQLENDVQNFMQFKTMGGRLILKENVVPHKNLSDILRLFENETSPINQVGPSASKISSYSSEERTSKYFKSGCLPTKEDAPRQTDIPTVFLNESSPINQVGLSPSKIPSYSSEVVTSKYFKNGSLPTKEDAPCLTDISTLFENESLLMNQKGSSPFQISVNSSQQTTSKYFSNAISLRNIIGNNNAQDEYQQRTIGTQCARQKYRSKAVMIKVNTRNSYCSPIQNLKSDDWTQTSVVYHPNKKFRYQDIYSDSEINSSGQTISNGKNMSNETDSNNNITSSDFSWKYSSQASSDNNYGTVKINCLEDTVMRITCKPMLYIELGKHCFFIVDLIANNLKTTVRDVLLCFKKIRLNNSFEILADDFNVSSRHASRIFSTLISQLAVVMKKFIIWPTTEMIKKNLPIPFRKRYSKVTCIIDCLEIQIEKPSNALQQSLTWSEYKKCNTMKYLISCTPDGTNNFISEGFGGRATDVAIVEESGFLELVADTEIMADRGFKGIDTMLSPNGCTLVRPPSTNTDTVQFSKEDVRLTKRIAALRIHVERVIGRIRLFQMCGPHATVDSKLIFLLNDIITVACGLINLDSPIINKL